MLELMIVIAIAGILSALAIPGWLAWRANAKINGAATNLRGDLEMAKMRAIKENKLVTVLFTSGGYTIFIDDNGDWAKDSGEALLRDRQLVAGVTANPINFNGSKTGFNGRSIVPLNGGIAQDGDITLEDTSGKQRKIFINSVGRISLQY